MLIDNDLKDINCWRLKLGLLPMPLFPNLQADNKYVMLNGNMGNFCLDLDSIQIGEEARNYAWSSNVGHYITVDKHNIEVQRWDKRASIERYSYKSVLDNLEKFHSYLESDKPKGGISVVSHSIGVFRQLRALLKKEYDGFQSLKTFLFLLACTSDGLDIDMLEINKWGLDSDSKTIASLIQTDDWKALQERLISGRKAIDELTLDLSLVLRHASGQLFQEAHYEASFIPQEQLRLGGFLPSPTKPLGKPVGIGVHFTPPALARALTEQALSTLDKTKREIIIFDPACGSGEFLREALRQLTLSEYQGNIKLIGWDQSPAASAIARFSLNWEKRNTKQGFDFEIQCVDSLSTHWPTNIDIVLMNPPFLSWQNMNEKQRESIMQSSGLDAKRRPDLSYAFIWRASSCIRADGILATIMPASILDSFSAEKLRDKLSREMTPRLIARLGSQFIFSGATIDTALYIAEKKTSAQEATLAFWADHRASSNSAGLRALRRARQYDGVSIFPIVGEGFNIYLDSALGRDSKHWAPRPYETLNIIRELRHFPRVQDIFKVSQGIRTGRNEVFKLEKRKWMELPADEQVYFRPAVVSRSIQFGFLKDTDYVFYPYGEKSIMNEQELEKLLPQYYKQYLLPNKQILSCREISQNRWWHLSSHRSWQIQEKPKLVSAYFGDAGSFAWDETGKFVVLQGFAWLPKYNRILSRKVTLAYLAILNSKIFSTLLKGVSNNVGGGQWNLSKKYVDNIAIPDLFGDSESDIILKLSELGENIHFGNYVDIDKLQELTYAVYGITNEKHINRS